MNRFILAVSIGILFISLIFNFLNVIYIPVDILNLFPLYHNQSSSIPHNTLVSDPVFQFEPWRFFSKQQILNGRFPFWNNLNSGGIPLFANGQSAVLFPLTILYYILPISISLNLIPLLKLVILFTFMYLYLRSIKISKEVSMMGGIVLCFSGFPIVWLLWPHTNVYIFLPLFLLLTEKIIYDKNKRASWLIFLSVSYFLAILGGHYETLFHISILHLAYIVFRAYREKKLVLKFGGYIAIGFLLAGFQLMPFIEYLLNSYVLVHRTHSEYLYLPFQSFALNIIPFISGAPHIQFYKPIVAITNFQESIGGYTGLIVFIAFFITIFTNLMKNSFVKFWILSTVVFLLLAYKVWPLGLLLELPFISQTQNTRLSALAAFSMIMVFVFCIEKIETILKSKKNLFSKSISYVSFFLLLSALLVEIATFIPAFKALKHPFIPILVLHICFVAVTTLLCLLALKNNKNREKMVLLLTILIGFQTVFLLRDYIPFLPINRYYPITNVIKDLQHRPQGPVLEIGNPSLAPNINLIYNIEQAQSYDAIEIKSYKEEFDKSFPVKNHWGKVEVFTYDNLRKFGIKYLMSDFNVNDSRQSIQPLYKSIIGPLTKSKIIEMKIIPSREKLSGIRFLPANYNRRNHCTIASELIDTVSRTVVNYNRINCLDLLDKMFFTIDINGLELSPARLYVLKIYSPDATEKNEVGLWGYNNKPYLEVFYENNSRKYTLLAQEKNVKLFEVPNVEIIDGLKSYRVISENSQKLKFIYDIPKSTKVLIKKNYYPGWEAYVDNKKVTIQNGKPFIVLDLPNGLHKVIIQYNPLSFKIGVIVTVAASIVLYLLSRKRG